MSCVNLMRGWDMEEEECVIVCSYNCASSVLVLLKNCNISFKDDGVIQGV